MLNEYLDLYMLYEDNVTTKRKKREGFGLLFSTIL